MHDRRRIAALALAAFAAALPSVAGAQAAPPGNLRLNFAPPKGWTDSTRPNDRPGIWKDWVLRDGGTTHSIVLSVTRENAPAAVYGAASVNFMKGVPGVTLLESGAATACGDVPAYTYVYRSDRTPGHPMIIRHLLVDVGSLLGDVSYARPPDAADRADARDAMSTLCEQQIYTPRAPAGWKSGGMYSPDNPGIGAFTSPAGDATLIALAVAMPVRLAQAMLGPTSLKSGATLIADAEETCGTTRVRHARWRATSDKGAQLVETVAGYRHGTSYMYTYTRPESTPVDPEAERTLTSFCAETAPAARASGT